MCKGPVMGGSTEEQEHRKGEGDEARPWRALFRIPRGMGSHGRRWWYNTVHTDSHRYPRASEPNSVWKDE